MQLQSEDDLRRTIFRLSVRLSVWTEILSPGGGGQTHLRWQRVVHQDVWTRGVRSEGPDGPRSQQIPVILGLEKLTQLLPVVRELKAALHVILPGTLGRLFDYGGAEGLMEEEQRHTLV